MTDEQYCFCELAPLYALDLLSDSERQWVEQQVLACPELTEELAQYQTAMATIPYGATYVAMVADRAEDLKDRLFERLELDPPVSHPTSAPTSAPMPALPPFLTVRSQDIQWQPHPAPGITVAIFYTDPVKQEISGLLRAEAGARYPFHRHADIEEIYMLSGDLIVEDKVYGAGDYIRSHSGSAHAPHTVGGCMFFFRTSANDEYPDLVAADA